MISQEARTRKYHLIPLDEINGYEVRPGFYEIYGATAIPGGVSFTVHSSHATSCELLLFRRKDLIRKAGKRVYMPYPAVINPQMC